MSVTVDDEESDCLDVDDGEPIYKMARHCDDSSANSDGNHHKNGDKAVNKPKSNKKISHTSELWNSLDAIIKGNNENHK